MKNAVLADTGPLYAAVDPSDAHHHRALRELRILAQQRREVIISFSTLHEGYSLILQKLGRKVSLRWLREISDAILINPGSDDCGVALTKLNTFPDQSITLFDATLAVLASRLHLEVWTYDHHFDLMRVPVWRG